MTEPVDVNSLQAQLETAKAALTQGKLDIVQAANTGNIPEMTAISKRIAAADNEISRLTRQLARAGVDEFAAERAGLQAQLENLAPQLAQSFPGARAVQLGITGVQFTFDEAGTVSAHVTKKPMKMPGQPRVMGKQAWTLNGQQYTSAELLAAFPAVLPTPEARNPKGLPFGLWALDRSKNFKDYGMQTTQGYSQEAQRLAKALGAVGSRV